MRSRDGTCHNRRDEHGQRASIVGLRVSFDAMQIVFVLRIDIRDNKNDTDGWATGKGGGRRAHCASRHVDFHATHLLRRLQVHGKPRNRLQAVKA